MLKPMRPIGCGALVVGVLVAWGSFATGSVPANDATVHTLQGTAPFTGDEQRIRACLLCAPGAVDDLGASSVQTAALA
jgi:hypothetical protein